MNRSILTCCLIFITTTLFAAPVPIRAINIQPSLNETRIIFVLAKKTKGKVTYLPAQKFLVVEFPDAVAQFTLQNTRLANSIVQSVTTKKSGLDKIQFYFGLRDKVHWRINFVTSSDPDEVRLLLVIAADHPIVAPTVSTQDIDQMIADLSEAHGLTGLARMQVPTTLKKSSVFTVVIDAGHGGHDAGAVGQGGIQEKKVVLAIAETLAQEINRQPGMRAVLTRRGDYFVPLRERLKLARKGEADLFIAIHADAHYDAKARGASVYALSQHGATTEAARWLAQKDNYAELDDVALNALQDRSSVLRSVLIDLAQTATIQDSIRLGSKILDKLDDIAKLHYKHVEQAPFVVLKSPDIPSVLIETGFISNPTESEKLSNVTYQNELAHALFLGIKHYAKK